MNLNDTHESLPDLVDKAEVKQSEKRRGGMDSLGAVQKMTATRRAQEDARWKAKTWLPTAVEMYQAGKGIKTIAKDTGASVCAVRNGLIWAGVYKGNKAEDISKRMARPKDFIQKKGCDVYSLILESYQQEEKDLHRFDEQKHWGDMPDVKKAIALASYYSNHESRKKDSASRALRRYYKAKVEKTPKDIAYLIGQRLRCRIRNVLRDRGLVKSRKSLWYAGCTSQELAKYIESKFVDGMSWDNMSEWHVDHIIPCASFDLTREDEQAKCFHYTNLQPLWARDNRAKGDRMPNGKLGRNNVTLYRRPYAPLGASI